MQATIETDMLGSNVSSTSRIVGGRRDAPAQEEEPAARLGDTDLGLDDGTPSGSALEDDDGMILRRMTVAGRHRCGGGGDAPPPPKRVAAIERPNVDWAETPAQEKERNKKLRMTANIAYAVGASLVVLGTLSALPTSGIEFTNVAVNAASVIGYCIGLGIVGAFLIGFVFHLFRETKITALVLLLFIAALFVVGVYDAVHYFDTMFMGAVPSTHAAATLGRSIAPAAPVHIEAVIQARTKYTPERLGYGTCYPVEQHQYDDLAARTGCYTLQAGVVVEITYQPGTCPALIVLPRQDSTVGVQAMPTYLEVIDAQGRIIENPEREPSVGHILLRAKRYIPIFYAKYETAENCP